MSISRHIPVTEVTAERLRELSRNSEPGTLLGSEDVLVATLGVSRATLRQAARVVEREGLLRVRRGVRGGYLADRPEPETILATVSNHLDRLDTTIEEVYSIASALWCEVLLAAAESDSPLRPAIAYRFADRIAALPENAPYAPVIDLEIESRNAIFELINRPYTELIFQINIAFANRHYPPRPPGWDLHAGHRQFVREWRSAKFIELQAIADGNTVLAPLAARHIRSLWHRRLMGNLSA